MARGAGAVSLRHSDQLTHKETGDWGEQFVVSNVECPNCGKSLSLLPAGYPLFDVQCTACLFRAQVKTANARPAARIRGAGWGVMSAALKSGAAVPPMLAVYRWLDDGARRVEVRFYPFIPRGHLKSRPLSKDPHHPRANYWMFEYFGMQRLPHYVWNDGSWQS